MALNINIFDPEFQSIEQDNDLRKDKNEKFDIASQLNDQIQNKDQAKPPGLLNFLTLEYYQPYFDLESGDVFERLLHAFKPHKSDFLFLIKKSPDLYGPVWIYATLIFLVAVTGNLSNYLKETENFKPDFNLVPTASILLCSFGFGIPLALFFLMKWFGSDITYIQALCTYGYSLTCFIPIYLLCIIPSSNLEWLLLTYGIVNSTAFLLVNFWSELGKYIDKKRYIVMGFIISAQFVVLLTYKLYFFNK